MPPEAGVLGQERARAFQRCIEELPSNFREAIVLREMEELGYQEIAEITGVPRGTVMSRLSRARGDWQSASNVRGGIALCAEGAPLELGCKAFAPHL